MSKRKTTRLPIDLTDQAISEEKLNEPPQPPLPIADEDWMPSELPRERRELQAWLRQLTDEVAANGRKVQHVPFDVFARVAETAANAPLAVLDTILDLGINVHRADCRFVTGSVSTVCPHAAPPLPEEYLPLVVSIFQRHGLLPEGKTLHWIGYRAWQRNQCACGRVAKAKEPQPLSLAAYLAANPDAQAEETAAAVGLSLDALHKHLDWKTHRNHRLAQFYAANPSATTADAAAYLKVGKSTVAAMAAHQEEMVRRRSSRLPSPARRRPNNITSQQAARIPDGPRRPNDAQRDALHADHYTADAGDPQSFRSLMLNVFDAQNETDADYRQRISRLTSDDLTAIQEYAKSHANPSEPNLLRLVLEQRLDSVDLAP